MSLRSPIDVSTTLSDEGRRRRDAMRDALSAEVVRTRARRVRRQRGVAIAALVLTVTALGTIIMFPTIAGTQPSTASAPQPQQRHSSAVEGSPVASPTQLVRVEVIQTDESIIDRYRVTSEATPVLISDEELLDALMEAGRDAGLVRTGQETRLVMNRPG